MWTTTPWKVSRCPWSPGGKEQEARRSAGGAEACGSFCQGGTARLADWRAYPGRCSAVGPYGSAVRDEAQRAKNDSPGRSEEVGSSDRKSEGGQMAHALGEKASTGRRWSEPASEGGKRWAGSWLLELRKLLREAEAPAMRRGGMRCSKASTWVAALGRGAEHPRCGSIQKRGWRQGAGCVRRSSSHGLRALRSLHSI